ncbi:uncharacterized protein F4822DRAFT_230232 [Hypoxylon trugodes]|uniref:uncharacterized protein n=1 Tax=Hypoxylon trugodes TaxID=326681 RepID=UPI0021918C5B|nr:uncharacterized protein F4822DRAFT_230232 [Hypoxylon trugodes]KAI1390246.1 hypothetical protein F4822DRAFT_230232 [Hypoxylon trugodes]
MGYDSEPITDLIEHYISQCDKAHRETTCNVMISLCREYFFRQDSATSRKIIISECDIIMLLEVAIDLKNHRLFSLVCDNIRVNLSHRFFSRMAICLRGSGFSMAMLARAFERSVLSQKTLSDQYTYISNFNVAGDEVWKQLWRLVFDVMERMVDTCYNTALYEQDGETLVLMACDR